MTTQIPPRRLRRQFARTIKQPWAQFKQTPEPPRAIPPLWVWTKAPWDVFAHIYTQCPTLAREWAGTLAGQPQKRSLERAKLIAKGMCGHCYVRWLSER